MKSFLFFTKEGFTYDPNDKEIENLQILGTGEGKDILEAFKHFKINQSYLSDFAFKEVIALEYVGGFIRNLEL
ncbi:hypothetical protein LXN10_10115 [Arcobacter sp. KX21116]|uniref:hypothetical protein n=1 Tax=Arcobacter iocasae TaxID=2906515 RepID=UPI0035D46D80